MRSPADRAATTAAGSWSPSPQPAPRLFDQVAPRHLANEDVLLSALTGPEREQLAALLRKLLIGFEHEHAAHPSGFTVAPAHRARRARAAVGLSDRSGLLVEQVEADSPADVSGLRPATC